jgi:hypothetical protein
MDTLDLKETFKNLKSKLGLKILNLLLEAGGLSFIEPTRAEVIENFMKCPILVHLMSEHDLVTPAPKTFKDSKILHILKKSKDLEAHMSALWFLHPNIFYTTPDIPTFLYRNRRLANRSPTMATARNTVIWGILTPLLLGMRDPACILSLLDPYIMRNIIKQIF